jgi:hypothetical protein
MDFENLNGKKIHQTKVKDFGDMFVNKKKNSKIFGKKSMASPRFDKSLENRARDVQYGTWGDVARGAHNSEGFALAGKDLGDAKVTNLDMIQGPYTYRIWFIVDKVLES